MIDNIPRGDNFVEIVVRGADGEIKDRHYGKNSRVTTGQIGMMGLLYNPSVCNGTSLTPYNWSYIALSTNTNAVAYTDTVTTFSTTPGVEITTNGLGRKQAAYNAVNTAGSLNATGQSTLYASWTASGAGTIAMAGLFNSPTASAGVLGLEYSLTTPISYNNGDSVSLTWTLNQ